MTCYLLYVIKFAEEEKLKYDSTPLLLPVAGQKPSMLATK